MSDTALQTLQTLHRRSKDAPQTLQTLHRRYTRPNLTYISHSIMQLLLLTAVLLTLLHSAGRSRLFAYFIIYLIYDCFFLFFLSIDIDIFMLVTVLPHVVQCNILSTDIALPLYGVHGINFLLKIVFRNIFGGGGGAIAKFPLFYMVRNRGHGPHRPPKSAPGEGTWHIYRGIQFKLSSAPRI